MNSTLNTTSTRLSRSLQKLMLEAVRSPRRAAITIGRSADATATPSTDICVECFGEPARRWSIAVAPHAISEKDLHAIRKYMNRPVRRWPTALILIPQLFGWGVGFTGLYAASTICPCCGQVGCALGIGTMGIVGGLTATVMSCCRWRRRKRKKEPQSC
jgi:hypothetical protein